MHCHLMTSAPSDQRRHSAQRWLLAAMVIVGLLLWLPIIAPGVRRQPGRHMARMNGRELRSDVGSALLESPAPADLPLDPALPVTASAPVTSLTRTSASDVPSDTLPGAAR